jgi:hypothetical protein
MFFLSPRFFQSSLHTTNVFELVEFFIDSWTKDLFTSTHLEGSTAKNLVKVLYRRESCRDRKDVKERHQVESYSAPLQASAVLTLFAVGQAREKVGSHH